MPIIPEPVRREASKLLALFAVGFSAGTQADNARDWQNLPKDLNMLFGYYNKVDTNTPIDTALPLDGLSLNADLYLLRYAGRWI